MLASIAALCALFASLVSAHMSMFHPSVYGDITQNGGLQNPLGPNWAYDDWWFRGPAARAAVPTASFELQAGGTATVEIACNGAWTSFGERTTTPGSPLDACPGAAGPYHADPAGQIFNQSWVGGCALAIADKSDINSVTAADIAVFSVQRNCVSQKMTTFEIPANMPPCSEGSCTCVWSWGAKTGTTNGYMTGFKCHVTGSPANATKIAPPQPPAFCAAGVPGATSCTQGSKQPLYVYNEPTNLVSQPEAVLFNDHRPSYTPEYGYEDGAQNDIFGSSAAGASVPAGNGTSSTSNSTAPASASGANTASVAKPAGVAVAPTPPVVAVAGADVVSSQSAYRGHHGDRRKGHRKGGFKQVVKSAAR